MSDQFKELAFARLSFRPVEVSKCERCGFVIVRTVASKWMHETHAPDSQLGLTWAAGCRSASFDRLGTWDDSIPRHWTAKPPADVRLDHRA